MGTKPDKIPSLDGLRAVAVFVVIWGHAELPKFIQDAAGVTVFFFLSGFLITTLLRAETDRTGTVALKEFYIRRTLRIWPPLYVTLALVAIIVTLDLLPNETSTGGWLSSLLFYVNYQIIEVGRESLPAAMNALWSLAVEEHFYLLFPLLYISIRRRLTEPRRQAAVLAAICALMLAWRCYLVASGAGTDRVYLSSDTRAETILLGCVMALVWNPVYGEARWPVGIRGDAALFGCIVVFWLAQQSPDSVYLSVGLTVQGVALFGILAAVIMYPDRLAGRILNHRAVSYVGVLSYTLYLVHRPFIELVHYLLTENVYIAAVIAIAASLLLAWAMHVWIEEPARRLRSRFSNAEARSANPSQRASRA